MISVTNTAVREAETKHAAHAHGPLKTLWHTPRRSLARRAIFQVHLWLGVLLGLYTAVIGLTGSALVFRGQIDRQLSPALFAVNATAPHRAPLAPVLRTIAAQFPLEHVEGIDNLSRPSHPAIVYLSTGSGAEGSDQRMVSIDQATGRILGSRMRYAGFLGVCANLHYYLLAGPTGYVINGVCACAFLLLCCTGWMLWWPGRSGLRRGLRVHWRARWKRLNWDLHAVGGFWTNPLLIAVVATGILFVFPKPILDCLAWAGGAKTAVVTQWLSSPQPPASGTGTISPDAALAQASGILREHGSRDVIHYLAVPTPTYAVYDAIAYRPHGAHYALPTYLYLNAHTGKLLAYKDARALPRTLQWATYAYAVHFGEFGGLWIKVLWVMLGILPAALWVTGLLLWWNRGLRPKFARND
jgi:uncharacterized iron-regulated membrane protein